MPSTTDRIQLADLLKHFDEKINLSDVMINECYEFLFITRKNLTHLGSEIIDVLMYLKNNMLINGLRSLDDVITHYDLQVKRLCSFLDNLTDQSTGFSSITFNGAETDLYIDQAPVCHFHISHSVSANMTVVNSHLFKGNDPECITSMRKLKSIDMINLSVHQQRDHEQKKYAFNCQH